MLPCRGGSCVRDGWPPRRSPGPRLRSLKLRALVSSRRTNQHLREPRVRRNSQRPPPILGPAHSVIGNSSRTRMAKSPTRPTPRTSTSRSRRNGFLPRSFGLGMRSKVGETKHQGHLSLWGHAETYNRESLDEPRPATFAYARATSPSTRLGEADRRPATGSVRRCRPTSTSLRPQLRPWYPVVTDKGRTAVHRYGREFPAFGRGFQYSTPSPRRTTAPRGLYDPVRLLGAWDRPRCGGPKLHLLRAQAAGGPPEVQ